MRRYEKTDLNSILKIQSNVKYTTLLIKTALMFRKEASAQS